MEAKIIFSNMIFENWMEKAALISLCLESQIIYMVFKFHFVVYVESAADCSISVAKP